jgi:hypothetical protein
MIWPWLVGALALVAFLVLMWWVGARAASAPSRARAALPAERPRLHEEFFRAASASGKPRGLRWKACEWGEEVELARERRTGSVIALVGLTVQFEAIPGSDMEGLPAVGNLRVASAVFFYSRGRWHTTGKAVFNLGPAEAIEHFGDIYERVPGVQGEPGA